MNDGRGGADGGDGKRIGEVADNHGVGRCEQILYQRCDKKRNGKADDSAKQVA